MSDFMRNSAERSKTDHDEVNTAQTVTVTDGDADTDDEAERENDG